MNPRVSRAQDYPYIETCSQLLDWLYKDLTLQNLDKSMERTKTKLFMGMLQTLENVQSGKMSNRPELLKLWKSLKDIDPEFESYLKKNSPYARYKFWKRKKFHSIETYQFFDAIQAWKSLQETSPHYFKGLDKEYLLDDWDLATGDLIDHIGEIHYQNQNVKDSIQNLSLKLKEVAENPEKLLVQDNTIAELKKKVDDLQENIFDKSKGLFGKYLSDYDHVCTQDELNKVVKSDPENYVCLKLNQDDKMNVQNLLSDLSGILKLKNLNTIVQPTIPPRIIIKPKDEVDRLKIHHIDYDVNDDKKATHCFREPAVVDTLVIHHTATDKGKTVESINQDHINKSTNNEPWYMIGYNYIVSEGSNGGTSSKPVVVEGRPPGMKGSHAGGYTKVLSQERVAQLENFNIMCGHGANLDDYDLPTNLAATVLKNGTISGNVTSFGIAIVGNYEQRYTVTTGGVVIFKNYQGGTKVKYPSMTVLTEVAKLSCQLQRKYPNVKRIVPHSYFKNTNCPGSVIAKLQKIIEIANGFGCEFNLELRK